jgi:hypothetical protein
LAKQKKEEPDVTVKDALNAFIKCAEVEEGLIHHLQ